MKLTPMQKDVLRQLYAGRGMTYRGYTPGIHLPSCTYWNDEEEKFWDRVNYNITMRALREKELIELVNTEDHGYLAIKLTMAGQEVARGL